ncbi:MAG: hypothetical protein QXE84_08195 [Candidatus Nitrosotenuis sp.]|uniref:Uncharacterized protein n=1 Tax=Candidatus Nitrosotenuis uzonensis TaxID=1407055 RepID=A0A812F2Z0_9ARCH|nr:hypothetical protein [Candidatus Nitrosotenuis uzonensis]CAE6502227.1 hypothetical protein NUZ5A_51254 [Candidatus Nitrosotenuis uzonensis]
MNKQSSIILSIAVISAISIGAFYSLNASEIQTVVIGQSLPDFPVEYLAEKTPYAIQGTVSDMISVPVQYDEVGIANVFTDVVIKVTKDLNQQYTDDRITVRIQGGQTDKYNFVYESSPTFTIGEKVFIFVAEKEPNSIYGDNYYVAGLQHGKYNLDEEGTAKNKDPNRNTSVKSLEETVKKAKEKSKRV